MRIINGKKKKKKKWKIGRQEKEEKEEIRSKEVREGSCGRTRQIERQGCGAETIFFRSGSDFQKVSAPAPALAPALGTTCYHRFYVKKDIFHVFNERKST
jgi:hypothetical protein